MNDLHEDVDGERRKIETALARQLAEAGTPPPSPNLAAFEKARIEAVDWRGKCAQCGNTRVGTLAYIKTPCEKCGYGHIMREPVRDEESS